MLPPKKRLIFVFLILSMRVVSQVDSVKIFAVDPNLHSDKTDVSIYTKEESIRELFANDSKDPQVSCFATTVKNDKKNLLKIEKELLKLKKRSPKIQYNTFEYRVLMDIYSKGDMKTLALSYKVAQFIKYNSVFYGRQPRLYKLGLKYLPKEYQKGIRVKSRLMFG